jgi:hypothetical protein
VGHGLDLRLGHAYGQQQRRRHGGRCGGDRVGGCCKRPKHIPWGGRRVGPPAPAEMKLVLLVVVIKVVHSKTGV